MDSSQKEKKKKKRLKFTQFFYTKIWKYENIFSKSIQLLGPGILHFYCFAFMKEDFLLDALRKGGSCYFFRTAFSTNVCEKILLLHFTSTLSNVIQNQFLQIKGLMKCHIREGFLLASLLVPFKATASVESYTSVIILLTEGLLQGVLRKQLSITPFTEGFETTTLNKSY